MTTADPIVDVDVLYDADGVFVVDKPAGVAMEDLYAADPEASFLGRLDRATSGLAIATTSAEAAAALAPAWSAGLLRKEYLVVVHGKAPAQGRIDIPLASRRPRHKRAARRTEAPVKREDALTTYVALLRDARVSVLLAAIHTGRTHQIRRHMKAVGHPVVGDDRYGHERRDIDLGAVVGLMLHSARLSHAGDVPLLPRALTAPVPPRMASLLASLGLPPVASLPDET